LPDFESNEEVTMLVKEHMRHPVITAYPDTNLPDALDVMNREHIRRLPIVNSRGHVIGIVSDSDLLKASPSDATTLSKFELRDLTRKVTMDEIMTREVITIDEDTPIEEAARIMADSKVSGLPVMREGKLVGMITETDLFKTFLELLGGRDPGVRLTVYVPRGPGQIAKITSKIVELGGDIIALATSEGDSKETGQITMKISGVPEEELVRAITPLVSRVVDVRETTLQQ
jgi:acetoin utilization protein AcuB